MKSLTVRVVAVAASLLVLVLIASTGQIVGGSADRAALTGTELQISAGAYFPHVGNEPDPKLRLVSQVSDARGGFWPFMVGAPHGSLLYMGQPWGETTRFDVSDPSSPRDVGPPPFPNAGAIGFSGPVAIVPQDPWSSESLFVTYDLSDPDTPVELGSAARSTPPKQMHPQIVRDVRTASGRAVLSGYQAIHGCPSLAIADVADPTAPEILGLADWSDLPFNISGIALSADARSVYLAGGECHCDVCWEPSDGYLLVLDVTDPLDVHEIARLVWSDSTTDVVVRESLAYVAANEAGFSIVDVSEPGRPIEVGLHETGDAAERVALAWPYAGISYGGWFQLVDVSEPTRPRVLDSVDLPGDIRAMTWYRDHLWVYAVDDGLLAFRLER